MKKIKRKIVSMLSATMIFTTALPSQALANTLKESELYTLTIMHTNDIHGNVDNLPKYATIINQVKSQGKNVLVMDGGDLFLRGEFQELQGAVETELLNAMGYDVWVPGNNDFRVPPSGGTTTQGNQQLKSILNKAEFDAICANVTMKANGSYIDGMKPYVIKEVNGMKIGIIGVTSLKPQIRNWTEVADKTFEAGNTAVEKLVAEVNAAADITVVLSHTGLLTDLLIADIKGVSAVLGADDHYKLSEPIFKTNSGTKTTPITQNGGEENHFLGRLDLTFEKVDGVMVLKDFNGSLYDLSLVKPDETVQKIIDQYRAQKKVA